MNAGLIVAIAYGVIALVVFIVVIPKVTPHKSSSYGPYEEEDDFVIAFCIGLLWLPALVLLVTVDLIKLWRKQRKRHSYQPKHRASS